VTEPCRRQSVLPGNIDILSAFGDFPNAALYGNSVRPTRAEAGRPLGLPADKQTLAIYSLIHISPRRGKITRGASRKNRSSAQIYHRSNRISRKLFWPECSRKISRLLSYFFADGGRRGKFAQIEPLFFLKRRLTTALEKLKNKPFKVN
jgi:hypothetical protein